MSFSFIKVDAGENDNRDCHIQGHIDSSRQGKQTESTLTPSIQIQVLNQVFKSQAKYFFHTAKEQKSTNSPDIQSRFAPLPSQNSESIIVLHFSLFIVMPRL